MQRLQYIYKFCPHSRQTSESVSEDKDWQWLRLRPGEVEEGTIKSARYTVETKQVEYWCGVAADE